MSMEKTTTIGAIKRFFETPSLWDGTVKPVTMTEMKALTSEERQYLGKLCAEALGVEIVS
jgi:hypothetical protein